MKKKLLALTVAMTLATSAHASVPVFVINKTSEIQQLVETLLQNDWVRNVLYCLKDLQALKDLANLKEQMASLTNNLNFQDQLSELTKSLAGTARENLQNAVSSKLGELRSLNGTLSFGDLSTALASVKNSFSQPVEGLLKTGNLPDWRKEAELFIKKGESFIRDGKTYTEREMRDLWAKEGGGTFKADKDYYTSATGSSKGDQALAGRGTAGLNNYMKDLLQETPAVLPEVQQAASEIIRAESLGKNSGVKDLLTQQYVQAQKAKALEGLSDLAAKYYDPEKGYNAAVTQSMGQYNQAMSRASDLANNTAPGEAIKAVAGLLSAQIQQNNAQTTLLLSINDTLVDEIKMLDRIGRMQLETYGNHLQQNLAEQARLSDVMKSRQ